ncbi:MAG TPA: GvpL/GvpF family gas vesicle protein [Terriglobia bacterium]|nr:GvpL/GvpF family gas vesicle protein [Terriglobia bacterium]
MRRQTKAKSDPPESALYLYGISRAGMSAPARVMNPSIDGGHPVHAVLSGDFVCWVSAVDGDEFSEEINRNMENLEWLALHGVRHQQVVAEIAAKTAIVPARFGTVFSGGQALLKNVQGRKAALKKVFTRIAGADEWGVKVFDEKRTVSQVPPDIRSGKEYLQAKAARLNRPPDRDDSGLREFAAALKKIATESAPTGKISGAQPDLLWQATFLVPRGRQKIWDQTLKRFVKQWSGSRRIEVNGPWPPYSFVSDAE